MLTGIVLVLISSTLDPSQSFGRSINYGFEQCDERFLLMPNPMTNGLAYLHPPSVMKRKKFYKIEIRWLSNRY